MDTRHENDQSLATKLSALRFGYSENHDRLLNKNKSINKLPHEILRLILEYANTCNAPNYVTLAEVIVAISRLQPQECIINIPGLPFAVSDRSPPLLALLWARQVCRLWRTISDDVIYEHLDLNTWLTPAIGDQFMQFLRLHLEERETSELCYTQTHTLTETDSLCPGLSDTSEVMHLIVVHHREERKTLFHVFRQHTRLYASGSPISQEKQLWSSCDCTRPQSADIAIGTPFMQVLASDEELQKVVQLVWRTSFRLGSHSLIAGLQHLAIARRMLDA